MGMGLGKGIDEKSGRIPRGAMEDCGEVTL